MCQLFVLISSVAIRSMDLPVVGIAEVVDAVEAALDDGNAAFHGSLFAV